MKLLDALLLFLVFYFLLKAVGLASDFSHLKNLHAPGCDENGKPKWLKCPNWDWSLIPDECKTPNMISVNCLPRCGKYIDDKPDIGAWEHYKGITCQKPWGDWDGIPDDENPIKPETGKIEPPMNFRLK